MHLYLYIHLNIHICVHVYTYYCILICILKYMWYVCGTLHLDTLPLYNHWFFLQICTSNHIGWWYQHRGTCTYHWRSGAALVRPQWRRPGWRQIAEFWNQGVMMLKFRFRFSDVYKYIDLWRSTCHVRSCKSHTSFMSCELLVTFAAVVERVQLLRHSHEACYSAVPLGQESYPVTASARVCQF